MWVKWKRWLWARKRAKLMEELLDAAKTTDVKTWEAVVSQVALGTKLRGDYK